MKATIFLSLASAAIASAAGAPQVCAAMTANCDPTLLCADVTTTGECASLPIPAALVGAVGSGTLYHKATLKGNTALDATLFSTAACDVIVGESFVLPFGACTLVPNMTFPIYVKVVMPNTPVGTDTVPPSQPPTGTPSSSSPSSSPSSATQATTSPTTNIQSTATTTTSPIPAGATTTSATTPSANTQKGSNAVATTPTLFISLVAVLSFLANCA